jgi:hypothetical protein
MTEGRRMASVSKPLSGFTALWLRFTRRNHAARVFKSQHDAYSFVRQAYAERGVTDELRALHADFLKFKDAREGRSRRTGHSSAR